MTRLWMWIVEVIRPPRPEHRPFDVDGDPFVQELRSQRRESVKRVEEQTRRQVNVIHDRLTIQNRGH